MLRKLWILMGIAQTGLGGDGCGGGGVWYLLTEHYPSSTIKKYRKGPVCAWGSGSNFHLNPDFSEYGFPSREPSCRQPIALSNDHS